MSAAHPLIKFGRVCTPAETMRRVGPHMASLGITRLARQTGLDRIGIPVWAATRPNSLTLAVLQGKGVDDDAARTSALMEAAEYAVAERPDAPVHVAAIEEMRAAGKRIFLPYRQMPRGVCVPGGVELKWLEARGLVHGEAVWIPYEAARLDYTRDLFYGIACSSNGLASGNDEDEATLHAICELVERDAKTLSSFRSHEDVVRSQIDGAAFDSDLVDRLSAQIREAGLELMLFDQTTDIGIPVIQAVIRSDRYEARQQLDLAAGSGCHPFAAHAAVRAITEAAQTRITNISGARDDIAPEEYGEPLRKGLDLYLRRSEGCGLKLPPPSLGIAAPTPQAMLDAVKRRLSSAGIDDAVIVPLGGSPFGIRVVKAFAPRLEDRPVNRHWTPGPRMASAMLRLW